MNKAAAAARARVSAEKSFASKSIREQQALRVLLGLSRTEDTSAQTELSRLADQLLDDAPPAVLQLMEQDELRGLEKLQDLIAQRLSALRPLTNGVNGYAHDEMLV